MSEEQTKTADSQMSKIIEGAYIAKELVLLNGGKDNIVVIRGERTGSSANTMVLYSDAVKALEEMAPDTVAPSEEKQ